MHARGYTFCAGRVSQLRARARVRVQGCAQATVPSCSSSASDFSTTASSTASAVDFADETGAYGHASTPELLRSLAVLRLCKFPTFVKNADTLVAVSNRLLGKGFTSYFAKKTFFGHFCAGEDENDIAPVIAQLETRGVGGILDYAAEADVSTTATEVGPSEDPRREQPKGKGDSEKTPYMLRRTRSGISARTYEYVNEKMCDENRRLFVSCITSVHNVSPEGFAAIKLTALGNPKLLQRAAEMLVATTNLFETLEVEEKGYLTFDDFARVYPTVFTLSDGETLESVFESLFFGTGRRSARCAQSGHHRVEAFSVSREALVAREALHPPGTLLQGCP